jgi:Mg-chelatase subunit ChlD
MHVRAFNMSAMLPLSPYSLSSSKVLQDSARAAYEFLWLNGHASADSRVSLSHLGSALSHLRPDSKSFKWRNVFAAHPQFFDMLDLSAGETSVYAISVTSQRSVAPRLASSAPVSSVALVPSGSSAVSMVAMRMAQHGFFESEPSIKQQLQVKQCPRKTNVVVALDVSGSMHDEAFGRLTHAKSAIMQLWDVLLAGDSLTIITFNTQVTTVMPRRFKYDQSTGKLKASTHFHRADLQTVLNSIQAGGGTALYHALLRAIDLTETAATEDLKKQATIDAVDADTYQLFVITDGQDEDSASISSSATARAVNRKLMKPGSWAQQVTFSSCFVAIGPDAQRALASCTNGLDPQKHHLVDNIREGFHRVTDSIATIRLQQTQTFKKTSVVTGGRVATA